MDVDQLKFFELGEPCPPEIINCESIRAEYKRERDDLMARGGCGGCMERALRNKYITLIAGLIKR
jgi:hypothetical protein